MECPVCMESKDNLMTTICGHTFCTACVGQVVVTTLKCPLCRGLLMDEDISCKTLNDTIAGVLATFSPRKKRGYWYGYQKLRIKVDNGEMEEDAVGEELIQLLIRMAGEIARSCMKVQMLEAVVHRDTYLNEPSPDWRLQFI